MVLPGEWAVENLWESGDSSVELPAIREGSPSDGDEDFMHIHPFRVDFSVMQLSESSMIK